ncbi:unnamed protein product [Spirodela intermedia]|uniref:Response regulatory domain-containing protein n=1 Tax=Spirodela intermedia TaxID=51605 RepID=A0A7I8IRK9_SPIIN|nr:unnamed protein product [Spirodela intermedia]CAA6660196.1 unnamed protein product [Spirodela intermedia]
MAPVPIIMIAVDGGKKAIEVLGLNYAVDDPQAVNDCSIDLILTDYCMPEMNGYELLKAVKEHKLRKSIPVVLMSSENDPQRMTRCRAMGAEDFILKPLKAVDVQQLRHYTRPAAAAAVAMEAESAAKADGKRKLPSMKVVVGRVINHWFFFFSFILKGYTKGEEISQT